MESIKIYSVRGDYGPLSNNFKSYTNIDDESWLSISNYIYTKALPSIMYNDKIKKANPIDIHDKFDRYKCKSEQDVLSVGLLEALRVKFQNPKIMDILLSTGNSPIIYKSNNVFLGDGKDGDGKNMLGNYMVQIRDEVLNEKKREREIAEREELIYKAYLARYTLQNAFDNDDDLKEYFDLSFDEIINKYGREKLLKYQVGKYSTDKKYFYKDEVFLPEEVFTKYSEKNYLNYLPTKSTILEFYNESSEEDKSFINLAVLYPNILIYKIRKDLQNLAIRKENNLKNKVFDMYVQDLIKKKFPDLDKEKQEMYKNKMISNITYEQFDTTRNKVYYDLLENPNDLQDEVKILTSRADIPSKEEIKDAELIDITDVNFLEKNKKKEYVEEVKLEIEPQLLPIVELEEDEDRPFNPLDFGEYKVKKPKIKKKNKKSEFMEEIVDSSSSDDGASDDEDDYEKKYKEGSEAKKELEKVYEQQIELQKKLKKVKEIKPNTEFQVVDKSRLNDRDFKVVENIILKSDKAFSMWYNAQLAEIKNKYDEYVKENKDKIEQKKFLAEEKRKLDEKIKIKIDTEVKKEKNIFEKKVKEAIKKYRLKLESSKKEDGTPSFSEKEINEKVNNFEYKPVKYHDPLKNDFTLTKAIAQIHELKKKDIVPDLKEDEFNVPIELINVGTPVLIFAGKPPLNYVIEDYNLQLLSPIYYTGMLKIKNLEYPTISHYLYTLLFSLEYEVNTIRDAYNYILNYPLDVYNNLFGGKPNPPSKFLRYDFLAEYWTYVSSIKNAKKFEILAKEALDIKFINNEYQDILIKTGSNNIIYNDKRDSYLGTKDITTYNIKRENYSSTEEFILTSRKVAMVNQGLNFVGKYLMCLREQITTNRLDTTLINANDFNKLYSQGSLTAKEWSDSDIDKMCKDFLQVKNGSLMIKEWVNSKTDDMCKTILKFNQYYKLKYDTTINFEIDNGVKIIIKNIYMKSKDLLFLADSVNIKNIPSSYRDRIKSKYKNIFYVYDGVFWSNIFSSVLFLVNNISEPTLNNIEKILYESNIIISNNNPCLKIMPTAINEINCIVGAILNILLNIQKIYKEGVIGENKILSRNEKVTDFELGQLDIGLAVSIILNTKNMVTIDFKTIDEKLLYENIKDVILGEEGEDFRPIVDEEIEGEGEEEGEEGEGKEPEFEYRDEYLRDSDEEGEEGKREEVEEEVEEEVMSELGDYDYNQYSDDNEDDYGDNNDGANGRRGYKSKKVDKNKLSEDKEKKIKLDVHTEELHAYISKYNLFGIPVNVSICKLILNGAIFISKYKNISIKLKRNRYNFFCGNQV